MNMYFLASMARESTEIYKDPLQVSRPFPKLFPRFSYNNDLVSKIFSLEDDKRSTRQIFIEENSTAEIFFCIFSLSFFLKYFSFFFSSLR